MDSHSYTYGYISKSEQGIFCFPKDETGIGRSLISTGTWGREELLMLNKIVQPDDEILFLGAHIGTIAIPLSRACKSIHAIEANPDIFKFLVANITLNDITNITPHMIAASDSTGTTKFLSVSGNTGGSKIYPLNPHQHYLDNIKSIYEVKKTAIDEFLPDINPRIIFIDIEGSEYLALKGMTACLKTADVLFIEYIPYHLEYVAGVSPEDFSSVIEKYFNFLYVPGFNIFVEKSNFKSVLRQLYDNKHSEDQIVFSKDLHNISKLKK